MGMGVLCVARNMLVFTVKMGDSDLGGVMANIKGVLVDGVRQEVSVGKESTEMGVLGVMLHCEPLLFIGAWKHWRKFHLTVGQ